MSTVSEIATIDCSLISGPLEGLEGTEGFKKFTEELGRTMSGIGFAYLVNYGTDPKIVENANAVAKNFFLLPDDIKRKYRKANPLENFNGYTGPEDEIANETDQKAPDYKEAWDGWGKEMMNPANYPVEAPKLMDALNTFRESLVPIAKKLLLSFGHYLKLEDPKFFLKRHRAAEDMNILSHNCVRTTYYKQLTPNEEIAEDAMRLGEHNDLGTITLLFQDMIGGLEAKKRNGEWVPVTPLENSIVLNAGLMLEMWSGGLFAATPHRVRLLKSQSTTQRQSLVFFVQPDGDSNCVPLVKEQPNWTCLYPKVDKETHFEYFWERIRKSRGY